MGFTKLDEGIIFSSVMLEPPDVFKVWITMLAMCKGDGVCRASSVGISAISHLGIDIVDNAISILESPDTRSRSINDEGRRIRRIDGGYEIINYMKYRELSKNEAEAKRKWEGRHRPDMSGQVQTTPDSSASVVLSCSGSLNTLKATDKDTATTREPTWRESFDVYVSEHNAAVPKLLNDAAWIAERKRFNPGVDIVLSIQKAAAEYWGTEEGWQNKKSKRTKTINWKSTYTKAVSINRVYERRAAPKRFGPQEVTRQELKSQAERFMERHADE